MRGTEAGGGAEEVEAGRESELAVRQAGGEGDGRELAAYFPLLPEVLETSCCISSSD